ncbi:MAG: ribosome biogenesis GTPase Der [Campylobacterota bacterium]|nr:ribosome biogenesis GTPase Der [Campylobacterota bacterium]
MKKLAIIGKPNVGKSSFFNRILRERDAITSEQAGTTRDIKRRYATIINKRVEILDTGGLDQGCELFDKIKEKSIKAAHEADIILYMVDGKSLPEMDDKKFFYELETMGKTVALVVNKIDNDKMKEKLWEYYEFGTDDIFGISISHNRGVNALLTWINEQLPDSDIVTLDDEGNVVENVEEGFDDSSEECAQNSVENEVEHFEIDGELGKEDFDFSTENLKEDDNGYFYPHEDYAAQQEEGEEEFFDEDDDALVDLDEKRLQEFKVAIIGRVNVGKSSLLNALVDDDRAVVSSVAGTTIDPIDETFTYEDKKITFVDTAGIRKRGKILGIEKFALMRTQKQLDSADIALLVLDASEPFLDLDEKIAGLIDENRLGCMIILNKWDIAKREDYDKIIQEVRDRFKFLHYAPIITVSAQSKQRVNKIFDKLVEINDNFSQRIPTSKVNEVIEMAMRRHTLPSMHGQRIRLYFATQYETRPPKIALVMNKPKGLHFTYRRYLTNKMREAFNFEGVPVLFKAKAKKERKRK